jgi:GNAT superfamily N-acetyltransferase
MTSTETAGAQPDLLDGATFVTAQDFPEFRSLSSELANAAWPEFMHHDAVANAYWSDLVPTFGDFQFALIAAESSEMIAFGNSLPLAWTGEWNQLPDGGLDWAVDKGFTDQRAGRQPTVQCALQIVIAPAYRGRGVSRLMVEHMKTIGLRAGLVALVAPVRPTLKPRYPLVPIADYVGWQTDDGLPFDPWMRVHARLNAATIKPCPHSMRIEGTVGEWEAWTGMRLPQSGQYVVPGALVPVEIDRDADRGLYLEPNVWMVHTLDEQ